MKYTDKQIVEVTATCATIIMFLSGSIVCKKVISLKTTGNTSALPFLCGFLSCILWLTYGTLKNDSTVIFVNAVGTFLQILYVIVFFKYAPKGSQITYQFLMINLVLILFFSYINYEEDRTQALNVTGTSCVILTLICVSSPLVMLIHVIKVRSTEALPFPVILTSFFVSSLWYIYGSIVDDEFMKVPNAIGALLSASQLSLFICFPSSPAPKYSKVATYIT